MVKKVKLRNWKTTKKRKDYKEKDSKRRKTDDKQYKRTSKMEEWVLAIGDIIVGIDIGTSKVSLVIGEVNNFNQIEVICTASHKCNGIQKGKIIDENEIAKLIHKAIKEAESEASLRINSAYVTIPGKYVTIVQNSIIKEARDKYAGISAKDVATAIMQVKDIDVPDE